MLKIVCNNCKNTYPYRDINKEKQNLILRRDGDLPDFWWIKNKN